MSKPVGYSSIATIHTFKTQNDEAERSLLDESDRLQAAMAQAEQGIQASYQATADLHRVIDASAVASQNLVGVIIQSDEVNQRIADDQARRTADVAAAEAARKANGFCGRGKKSRFTCVAACVGVVCCVGAIALAAFAFTAQYR